MTLILHSYWRATAPYRLRIALNLKGLPFDYAPVNLVAGDQLGDAYRRLNPQGLTPALETEDGPVLTQSLAILEWLEETHPLPALLPEGADERAVVRAMVGVAAADTNPLANLKVMQQLRARFEASDEQVNGWAHFWISEGLATLEPMVAEHGGGFAYGDTPTLADCMLAPVIYSARRFNVDLAAFPAVLRAHSAAADLPAFAEAHPDRQPDAPHSLV